MKKLVKLAVVVQLTILGFASQLHATTMHTSEDHKVMQLQQSLQNLQTRLQQIQNMRNSGQKNEGWNQFMVDLTQHLSKMQNMLPVSGQNQAALNPQDVARWEKENAWRFEDH